MKRRSLLLSLGTALTGCTREASALQGGWVGTHPERGHRLLVVTSMAHTSAVASRHPSGRRLFELADVVLDNGAPYGDAALHGVDAHGDPVTACAVSSITAALLSQMVVAEVGATGRSLVSRMGGSYA